MSPLQKPTLPFRFSFCAGHVTLLFVVLGFLAVPRAHAQALTNGDRQLHVTATATDSPPSVTLTWNYSPLYYQGYPFHSFHIKRRVFGTLPFTVIATVTDSTQRQYVDASVQPGVLYEYLVTQRSRESGGAFIYNPPAGFVASGVSVPLNDQLGTILLLVDETMAAPLAAKIDLFERNLIGAGWRPIRMTAPRDSNAPGSWGVASRTSDPRPTKQIIADVRAANPDLKGVILFGHITVPFSGNINPDGHATRALAADAYYSDFDEQWTDIATFPVDYLEPQNRVGDLRWDKSYLTTGREMMLGRIDFSAMSAFTESEQQLLDRYIGKNHQFRHGRINTARKALVSNFSSDWAGWLDITMSNHSSYFGRSNVEVVTFGSYKDRTTAQSYLWASVGAGGGVSTTGGASTTDMAASDSKVTFFTAGASYMVDTWQNNSLIRASIAMPTWGIGAIVSHLYMGEVVFPSFSMGRPLGEINMGPVENYPRYFPESPGTYAEYQRNIFSTLHGDPTVTMYVTPPVSNLVVTSGGNLQWSPSPAQNLIGYHVYRTTSWSVPFQRLTSTPITTTSYVDSTPRNSDVIYMVRAVNLETRGTGTYQAASQGVFAPLTLSGQSNSAPTVSGGTLAVNEDTPTPIVLPAADAESNPLNFIITRHPASGKLLGTGQTVTYVPPANFSGTDSFEYIVNDGFVDSAPATVNVTVAPLNDPPVLTAPGSLSAIRYRGRPTFLRLEGTDVEGQSLSYRITSAPTRGQASISNNLLTYWPEPGSYTGPDAVTVVANDGQSDSAPVVIPISVQTALNLEGSSLKAWWKLDDAVGATTAVDSNPSSTKFPGLVVGTFEPSAGLFGGAFRGSSANNTVKINDAIYGFNETVYRGAASMWFKPTEPANSSRYQVVMKMGSADNVCWNVYIRGGKLYVYFRTSSSFQADTIVENNILANQWYHVALSYDFSASDQRFANSIQVYINGKFSGHLAGRSFSRLRSPHGIGNQAGLAQFDGDWKSYDIDSWFNGWVDEVRHYNVPISPAQAQALYDAGVTPPANQAPVAVGSAALASPSEPLNTVWSAQSSSDPDGFVYSYTWNFDDGTTASGASVQKSYTTGGNKTAQLTVRDNEGATSTVPVQITLTAPVSSVTTRGTPTQWLQTEFGATSNFEAIDAMDHDGDGQPAWLEYRAGTDPNSNTDSFRILDVTPQGNGTVRVRWTGSAMHGHSTPFKVLSSDTLSEGSWQVREASAPRDASGVNTWFDSTPWTNGRRFYRIEAP
jgi:hypothetical protein